MTRLLFTIQYLGTRYAGWQMQANAIGVQSVFEEVLARLFGAPVRVEGAKDAPLPLPDSRRTV